MSYILDSLKKSDKERQSINHSAAMVMRSPAFLENDKRPHNPIIWMALVVVVLCLVIYFGFFGEINTSQFFSSEKSEVLVDSNPIIHKEIVIAPPVQQLSKEKQDAILLYEQALQQKSKPEVDSLYRELNDKSAAVAATIESQESDDDDANPNGPTPTNAIAKAAGVPSTPTSISSNLENSRTVSAAPEDESIAPVTATTEKEDEALTTSEQQESKEGAVIPSIYALESNVKKKIPSINYGAHIYATDNKSGFVILNGARRRIGDKLSNGVYIEKIAEESVVLSFNGTVFSLPAMKSWLGE